MRKRYFLKIIKGILNIILILALVVLGIYIYEKIQGKDPEIYVEQFLTILEDTYKRDKNMEETSIDGKLGDLVTQQKKQETEYKKENHYFYNQLEVEAKKIYNAFENNETEMIKGNYEINLGNSFSEVLNITNGQEKLGEYYQSAIEAYLYDNPQIFYIDSNKMYLNIETTTKGNKKTYRVFINCGENENYFTNEFESKEKVELAIKQIENIRNLIQDRKTGNTYEDIKMIHDYLVDSIEYETTISKENIYNIYGALVNRQSVCEGYAKAFKYLLDEFDIPCIMVIGKGQNKQGNIENHAWNYVKLQNNWYAIDVTWDDPIIIGGGTTNKRTKYQYFLKGSEFFNQNHRNSGYFTEGGKEFTYPDLKQEDY